MKKATGITIDEDLWEIISENKGINLSGLVNQFLRNYFAMGMDSSEAAKRAKAETLKHEREEYSQKIREIDAVLESLDQEIEEAEKAESEVDRELGRFVSEGGAIRKLSSLNYAHLRRMFGLSEDEADRRLEEIAEPRRKEPARPSPGRRGKEPKPEPISQGSMALMEQLDLPFEPGMSEKEAGELIRKAVGERDERKNRPE